MARRPSASSIPQTASGDDPLRTTRLLCAFWVAGKPISLREAYGRRRGQAGSYLNPQARGWREQIALEALCFRQQISAQIRAQIAARSHGLRVIFTIAGVRGDVDNYCKLALDGLKDGLQIDDRYIADVTAQRLTPAMQSDPDWAPYATQSGISFQVWLDPLTRCAPPLTPPNTPIPLRTPSAGQHTGQHTGDSLWPSSPTPPAPARPRSASGAARRSARPPASRSAPPR